VLRSGNHNWVVFSHVFSRYQREFAYAACGADEVVACSSDARDDITPNGAYQRQQFIHFFGALENYGFVFLRVYHFKFETAKHAWVNNEAGGIHGVGEHAEKRVIE
jgi:hypothetical protein